ncbi:MAG: hypothetical protein ACYDEX_00505 [Mobilitalea sp.]
MKCNICGRQSQNEEANFCEYCGSSFREHVHTALNSTTREQIHGEAGGYSGSMAMQMTDRAAGQTGSGSTETDKPISFLNWLATYGIIFIPFFGGIIFIVQLFVWAFSNNAPANKKNWARATLIFVGVSTVIIIFLLILWIMVTISSPIYQEMMGTLNYDSLNDLK